VRFKIRDDKTVNKKYTYVYIKISQTWSFKKVQVLKNFIF